MNSKKLAEKLETRVASLDEEAQKRRGGKTS